MGKVLRRHVYDGERCQFCGVNKYDQTLYGATLCVEREPIMHTSETSETSTSRADHLAWCKARALQYVEAGDLPKAIASMIADTNTHPETAGHVGGPLGIMGVMTGRLSTAQEMRQFIEGFH